VDAGIRNSLSRDAHHASRRNQLTGRRPSAICSRRVGRAYTSASCVPQSGLASLHSSRCPLGYVRAFGSGGRPALAAQARCWGLFTFRARHLSRLGVSTGGNGGRCHAAVNGGFGRIRRWSGLGSRAELQCSPLVRGSTAPFDVGVRPGRGVFARARRHRALRPNSSLKVCLGGRASRGGEWDLQSDPVVTHVFRPRSRGGSCECPFWLGRRERHVGPGRTAPKTGRSSAGWIGGGPGTARDTRTDGLAEMTRSLWRSGEPSKVSISSGRLRPDSRVVLAVRRFPRAGRSCFSATTLPPTDSRAALSLGHAQHVGHQCRYR